MLEQMHDLPGHIAGISAKGRVSKADYQRVVEPLLKDAKREGRPLRLLYELGSQFEGFTPAAMLQDARLGLQGAGTMERIALVSDTRWVRTGGRLLGEVVPCPLRVFGNSERAKAIDWLSRPAEHRGLSHRVVADGRAVLITVLGPITTEDFEALDLTLDHLLGTSSLEGVVVHVKNGPSWQNLGSFLRHVGFVREHHRQLKRLALVAEGKLAVFMPAIARQLLAAEVHGFSHRDLEVAVQWAATPTSGPHQAEAAASGREPPLDPVQQAGVESFPASDPPSFTPEA
jgi:hypothetical protein